MIGIQIRAGGMKLDLRAAGLYAMAISGPILYGVVAMRRIKTRMVAGTHGDGPLVGRS